MRADVKESSESEGTRKLFVGAFNMHVTAVNPTLEELQKMGVKTDKKPDYFVYNKDNKELVDGIKIRIYLENKFREDDVKAVLTLYLRKSFMESKKDPADPKANYIDERGNSMFLSIAGVESGNVGFDWLHIPSLKKAVMGEAELIQFIRALTNAEKTGVTYFEPADLKKIFAGDVSSIRSVVKRANELGNAVRVLLMPKIDGAKVYQYVYDRSFDRSWSSTAKYMHKSVMENKSRLPKGVAVPFSETLNETEFFIREVDPLEMITKYGDYQSTPPATPSAMGAIPGTTVDLAEMTRDISDDDLPF
jgi:hypothetical protein